MYKISKDDMRQVRALLDMVGQMPGDDARAKNARRRASLLLKKFSRKDGNIRK